MPDKIFGDFFQVLAYFSFATSEAELDYYHQGSMYRLPHELLSDLHLDHMKVGNLEKIARMLGIKSECQTHRPKCKFRHSIQKTKKSIYHILHKPSSSRKTKKINKNPDKFGVMTWNWPDTLACDIIITLPYIYVI